ncbi:MAG: hypothetical protein H6626_08065 [Pseudobdellovibrionaceae bacterium]|nr:hypothetical protein [Bdellovibrionales bacterium]USN46179.1 MAG: hypothetical protein H6626_08065 [Pseudobdellovibrionaceae bacterium]
MNKYELRQKIGREEFSYQSLMVALKAYKAPLQKINELLKSGQLIRVKKGLYVLEPDPFAAYNPLLLANLIYGPSYISFETALSIWGLIPERVEEIKSVTSKRNKSFTTPIGRYSYRYVNPKKYKLGIMRMEQAPSENIIIASPEKALVDTMTLALKSTEFSFKDLLVDLRVDESRLVELVRPARVRKIVRHYNSRQCQEFLNYIENQKESNG